MQNVGRFGLKLQNVGRFGPKLQNVGHWCRMLDTSAECWTCCRMLDTIAECWTAWSEEKCTMNVTHSWHFPSSTVDVVHADWTLLLSLLSSYLLLPFQHTHNWLYFYHSFLLPSTDWWRWWPESQNFAVLASSKQQLKTGPCRNRMRHTSVIKLVDRERFSMRPHWRRRVMFFFFRECEGMRFLDDGGGGGCRWRAKCEQFTTRPSLYQPFLKGQTVSAVQSLHI